MKNVFYRTRTWSEHGYTHTEIVVFGARERTLQDKLDGTVGNRDGYGSEEAVQTVARRTQALIDKGYTHLADVSLYEPRVRFVWQHYGDNDFCAPRVELGDQLFSIQESLPLLRKIARSARKVSENPNRDGRMVEGDIANPAFVLSAMKKLKITQVLCEKGEEYYEWDDVYKAA